MAKPRHHETAVLIAILCLASISTGVAQTTPDAGQPQTSSAPATNDNANKASMTPSPSPRTSQSPSHYVSARQYVESINRKIQISPIPVSTGILSGLVIIDGHVILAPYQAEFVQDKLFVNGVQTIPSLIDTREAQKRKSKRPHSLEIEAAAFRDIENYAQEEFIKDKGRISDNERKRIILEYVLSQPLVDTATWDSDRSIRLFFKENKLFGYEIDFYDTEPSSVSSDELNEQSEETHLELIQSIRALLKQGKTIIFPSHGQFIVIADPRTEVNKIMTNARLSDQERLDLLDKNVFTKSHIAALDVLENYNALEWATPKQDK